MLVYLEFYYAWTSTCMFKIKAVEVSNE